MGLKALTLKDQKIFSRFLGFKKHELSVYAFPNIYIWKTLFRIRWQIIEDNLCIFFQDKIGCFLYLAPQGRQKNPRVVVEKMFGVMDRLNKNKEVSRIENIAEEEVSFYRDLGYSCRKKSDDYLCLRNDLANLTGNKFKSKRASYNYFTKHYPYEYLPFSAKDIAPCLKLYNYWMKQRQLQNQDVIYQGLMQDSAQSLKVALDNYVGLGLSGRIVKINGAIKAFTFGFELNPDTFCVLYEITDLTIKGLAQFIFREFCAELKGYKYINIMDDSGLENLKKVKLSYHPARLIPAYSVKRCA